MRGIVRTLEFGFQVADVRTSSVGCDCWEVTGTVFGNSCLVQPQVGVILVRMVRSNSTDSELQLKSLAS